MIRNLPEGSRFAAAMTVDRADEIAAGFLESDPRRESIMDARTWNLDRRLQATAVNAIYSQTSMLVNWGKEGPPDFPVIGPAAWQSPKTKKSEEPKNNFDVLRKMGWPGG
jgi:hypothetical protein